MNLSKPNSNKNTGCSSGGDVLFDWVNNMDNWREKISKMKKLKKKRFLNWEKILKRILITEKYVQIEPLNGDTNSNTLINDFMTTGKTGYNLNNR